MREQQWRRGCADAACAPAQKARPAPVKAERLPMLSLGGASFPSPGGTDVESPQAPGAAAQRGPVLADNAAAGFPASPSPPPVSLGHIVSRFRGAWCSAGAHPHPPPHCKLGACVGGHRQARAVYFMYIVPPAPESAEPETLKCPDTQEDMAAGDCPSPHCKRRELPCEEGEVGAEGWPRVPKRARTSPAASCHAGRPTHCMRPGGLSQARRWAGGALSSIAGVLIVIVRLLYRC